MQSFFFRISVLFFSREEKNILLTTDIYQFLSHSICSLKSVILPLQDIFSWRPVISYSNLNQLLSTCCTTVILELFLLYFYVNLPFLGVHVIFISFHCVHCSIFSRNFFRKGHLKWKLWVFVCLRVSLFCLILDCFHRFQILSHSLSELWRHRSTVFKTSELLMRCDSHSFIQHMFLVLSLCNRNEKNNEKSLPYGVYTLVLSTWFSFFIGNL